MLAGRMLVEIDSKTADMGNPWSELTLQLVAIKNQCPAVPLLVANSNDWDSMVDSSN